ncbi:dual specificity phosphatase [Drechmeria coniospora]|uniref:Dual specificity phosphatase n=1 Tax=Drechmeria coniospora TaxID=98403 RepID=A0A151GG28_DRECN|nr:dual specificity phosphatase [Drechmeria coniospora]KYK56053.1 dual specificity phosphatase [Drechmeria coniospora]
MATVALPRPIPHRNTATDSNPITPPHTLQDVGPSASSQKCIVPLPNRHIPACPTGPSKAGDIDTPPESPQDTDEYQYQQTSLLYPPDAYTRIDDGDLSIYEIDADQIADSLSFAAGQPLPPPSTVFPWLHGLHPNNQMQQAFFMGRRSCPRSTPSSLRAVTLVKADGDLTVARLKGAIAPDEFLRSGPNPDFIEADPADGFSVRNFQIQPAKVAFTSDIIVYGNDLGETRRVAWAVAGAQLRWRQLHRTQGKSLPEYNTFFCTSTFDDFVRRHGDLVAVDSAGNLTGNVLDFVHQERREMWNMTEASEISHNVFLGPTPESGSAEERKFEILIECSDLGRLNPTALKLIAEGGDGFVSRSFIDFPSSGSILPPTWSHDDADAILDTCRWIYHLAHGAPGHSSEQPGQAAEPKLTRPRKILIHCADGYTESTLLGIAYFSYSTGRPIPDAWVHLHTIKNRNFFAYPTDVALLTAIAPRLLRESPLCAGQNLGEGTNSAQNEPQWLSSLDGSFPSRVLDYLYLGNLGHANNPDLLRQLGISQILSVGETATWKDDDMKAWGAENMCVVQGVQDNGIDPLTEEFDRCLEFIGESYHAEPHRIPFTILNSMP